MNSVKNDYLTSIALLEIIFYSLGLIGIGFFILSAIFYLMSSCMNPGYVRRSLNMLELLQLSNDKNIDLENFCFYCKVIKSTRTFHCMICGKCVEKFDHHCVYINNCLGYRNHKYFIMFLWLIAIYFVTSTATSIASFITHGSDDGVALDVLHWAARVYTVLINILQCIPLLYQLKEQTKKLGKRERVDRRNSIHYSLAKKGAAAFGDGGSTRNSVASHFKTTIPARVDSSPGSPRNMKQSLLSKNNSAEFTSGTATYIRGGCCQNLRELYCYRAPT